jgi:hypothetical protein
MDKVKSANELAKEIINIFNTLKKDEDILDSIQGKLMLWGISIADFAKDKPLSCLNNMMFK